MLFSVAYGQRSGLDDLLARELVQEDLVAILDIEKRSHLTPWSPQNFADAIGGRQIAIGLFQKELLLGYAVLSVVAGEAELLLFVIDERQQDKGFGVAFLQALLDFYQTKAERFFLEVRAGNVPAITLYEKLGFNQVGERANYYDTPWGREDALIYALDFSFNPFSD